MKKLLIALLVLSLLLAGCTQEPIETTAPSTEATLPPQTTSPPPETTLPPEPTEPPSEEILYFRENFPTLDGSTSMIPLEAGIRAEIFGISMEDATMMVNHTTTWGSFYSLLYGDNDMIFSVPLSAEQEDIAREEGVELESVPIAMEGFVFLVNAENPVDTLTQQQLRDIYSGKITNWSEVGGLDEEIIPYQRNSDSGSQNFMVDFMGDTPLTDAPTELRPGSMSGLIDQIAVNDNARNAIGYSVYTYAADMYGSGDDIKFIRVDGVAPSRQTFATGEYPLLGQYFAFFRSNQPEDGPVRRLVEWMTGFDGQYAIARAGYVVTEDIGFDYQEMTLSKFDAVGTGPKAAAPATYEYDLWSTYHYPNGGSMEVHGLTPQADQEAGTYVLTQLADKELQDEINAFIAQQMEWAWAEYERFQALDEEYMDREEYESFYSPYSSWQIGSILEPGFPAAISATCKNGYLSVAIAMCGGYYGEYDQCYRAEAATWDLLTGERLELTDLFCEGVDIDQVLNACVLRASQEPQDFYGIIAMKGDFVGLTTTGWTMTHDGIFISMENPYFPNGICIPLEDLPDGTLVTEQPRDFAHCFQNEEVVISKLFRTCQRDFYYEYNADEYVSCSYLSEDAHSNAAAINATVKAYLDEYYTYDAICAYYDQMEPFGFSFMDWYLRNWGGKYLVFQGSAPDYPPREENDDEWLLYPHRAMLIFDLETGQQLTWQDLLLPGWQEASTLTGGPDQAVIQDPDLSLYVIEWIMQNPNGNLEICLRTSTEFFFLTVPGEYIRY